MKVIYIAGPFRGPTNWDIEKNIREAQTLALGVWRLGAVALCPHTNTGLCFQGVAPDEVWLDGDLELLRRCDAVLLHPRWRESSGARKEYELANAGDIPRFEPLHVTSVTERIAAAIEVIGQLRSPPRNGEREFGEWLRGAQRIKKWSDYPPQRGPEDTDEDGVARKVDG